MKKLFILICLATIGLSCFAQFTSDKVYIYVKAGQDPVKMSSVIVIGYLSDSDEIVNRTTNSDNIRWTMKNEPRYLNSPYNLLEASKRIRSYTTPLRCQYNSSASTSKYTVYTGYERAGSNCWGSWNAQTLNWAFTKDAKRMIKWTTGNEDKKETYLLTDLSEFDPSTSHSSNYDFLE